MKRLGFKFPNIFFVEDKKGRKFYTQSIISKPLFDEDIKRIDGNIFRYWDPNRSKLCAALQKNLSQIGFKEGDKVLYLGASHGYTPSFVSDIVGKGGVVYALDFAPRVVRDLYFVCEKVDNIIPIHADAKQPQTYSDRVLHVDIVYMDIAQRNQVEIFLKNCKEFLNPGSFGLLALKSRSVDVTKKPKDIFKQVRMDLEKEIIVSDYRVLDPFEKDHALYVCKVK